MYVHFAETHTQAPMECSKALAFASAYAAFELALAFHCHVKDAFALAFDSSAFEIALAFDSSALD